jgi:nucleoside-diphosphate-sugar epimerase
MIGANGFVGRAVYDRLSHLPNPFLGMDLNTDGTRPIRKTNILDLADLTRAIPTNSTLIHLAGPVAGSFGKDFEAAWRLQVEGTSNVLHAASRKECRRIVFASSYHVYMAHHVDEVVDENTEIRLGDLDPFGSAKLISEQMARSFCAHRGIELVILRFGSVYGLGKCTNLMSELFSAYSLGNTVEIWGRGRRTNHYVDLDDLAQACLLALSVRPGLYNVLHPQRATVSEVCNIAEQTLGVKTMFHPELKERPSFPTIRSDKFMTETGWVPSSLFESFNRLSRRIPHDRVA